MVRNPTANINVTMSYMNREYNKMGTVSLLISALECHDEELFDTIIAKPGLNVSYVCKLYGRNALHYAMTEVRYRLG